MYISYKKGGPGINFPALQLLLLPLPLLLLMVSEHGPEVIFAFVVVAILRDL